VATGFITYVSQTQPLLMHCFGARDYSDVTTITTVQVSTTMAAPVEAGGALESSIVPEGRMRYAEPAAFFDPNRRKLIVLIDHTLYPKDKLNVDTEYGLELNIYIRRRANGQSAAN